MEKDILSELLYSPIRPPSMVGCHHDRKTIIGAPCVAMASLRKIGRHEAADGQIPEGCFIAEYSLVAVSNPSRRLRLVYKLLLDALSSMSRGSKTRDRWMPVLAADITGFSPSIRGYELGRYYSKRNAAIETRHPIQLQSWILFQLSLYPWRNKYVITTYVFSVWPVASRDLAPAGLLQTGKRWVRIWPWVVVVGAGHGRLNGPPLTYTRVLSALIEGLQLAPVCVIRCHGMYVYPALGPCSFHNLQFTHQQHFYLLINLLRYPL